MKKLEKLTLKEIGQEMSVITQSDALSLKGGDGSTVIYSWEDYQKLDAAGKWNGGYVEGCGYMLETATVFNMGGSYTTLTDFAGSQIQSGWDKAWSEAGSLIPGYQIIQNGENNQAWIITHDLLSRGYDGNHSIYIRQVAFGGGGLFGLEVYDSETGNLIAVY